MAHLEHLGLENRHPFRWSLVDPQDELAELREWLAAPEGSPSGAKEEQRRIAGLRCSGRKKHTSQGTPELTVGKPWENGGLMGF